MPGSASGPEQRADPVGGVGEVEGVAALGVIETQGARDGLETEGLAPASAPRSSSDYTRC